MLTRLSLTDFKSWKSIEAMRLAPITGLFGTNSSGKSSILQFLLMLKQTVESPDRALAFHFGDDRSLTNLGSFRDVIYSHKKPGNLHFALGWQRSKPLKITDPAERKGTLFEGKKMDFEATVSENGSGRLVVEQLSYGLAGHHFTMRRKGEGEAKYELQAEGGSFRFTRTPGRPWDLPPPIKCYGFPDQAKAYFQNAGFLSDLQLAFEQFFSSIYYLGPLREDPQRQYTWAGAEPADMGRRGERAIDALLAGRERGAMIGRGKGKPKMSLEAYVAYWLKHLGLIHEFSVEAIAKESNLFRVLVQKSPAAAKVLITDVGFGVSQVLPVIVLCYYVPIGSTILLEQPEIHLHPSVQAGLADVFIDAVNTRQVQIVIESHSEHLLRRLQRRIAENQLPVEDIALYFCDVKGGASRLTPLDTDMFGDIKNWPKDFFGNEMEELAATVKARIKRRSGEQ